MKQFDLDRIARESFVARVDAHHTLGSTNDRARLLAAKGESRLPLLVVTERQTAGRGRGMNRWWSPSGALLCSLLLDRRHVAMDGQRAAMVSLATSLAVANALAPRLGQHPVGIHWPNDVFAAGKKIAGILVEGLADGRCIIGIGVNTNNRLAEAPADVGARATSVVELTGEEISQTDFLLDLLGRLDRQMQRLPMESALLAQDADCLCLQRGEEICVMSAGRMIAGRCQGIAADGALLVETSQGRRSIYSGTLAIGADKAAKG